MADETMGPYTERSKLGFYRSEFTDAQRRRCEALILVGYMFPTLSTGVTKVELAQWVVSGKAVVR